MKNLANLKPSKALANISQNAQLTNAVSLQALVHAQHIYSNYQVTANRRRDPQDLIKVADQLRLIITQVAARRCRINPVAWPKLIQLESDLRAAAQQRLILEPNVSSMAANDDVEVA